MDIATIILSIVGFLITVLLSLNAFFIKDLVDKINAIGTNVAVAVIESGHLKSRIDTCEMRLNIHDQMQNTVREGLHSVRNDLGTRLQIVEMKVEDILKQVE